jgi:hypothetical protein
MSKFFVVVLKQWVPLAIVLTVACGLVYGVVQQDLRQGANDPQIQMAEDTAATMNTNGDIDLADDKVNIRTSLQTFIIVYDKQGNPVKSSAMLNQVPAVPSGVLAFAKKYGENRLTWQPEQGVRIAAVVVPYTNGYILVGRNLREVENREDRLYLLVTGSWIIGLVMLFLAITGLHMLFGKKKY